MAAPEEAAGLSVSAEQVLEAFLRLHFPGAAGADAAGQEEQQRQAADSWLRAVIADATQLSPTVHAALSLYDRLQESGGGGGGGGGGAATTGGGERGLEFMLPPALARDAGAVSTLCFLCMSLVKAAMKTGIATLPEEGRAELLAALLARVARLSLISPSAGGRGGHTDGSGGRRKVVGEFALCIGLLVAHIRAPQPVRVVLTDAEFLSCSPIVQVQLLTAFPECGIWLSHEDVRLVVDCVLRIAAEQIVPPGPSIPQSPPAASGSSMPPQVQDLALWEACLSCLAAWAVLPDTDQCGLALAEFVESNALFWQTLCVAVLPNSGNDGGPAAAAAGGLAGEASLLAAPTVAGTVMELFMAMLAAEQQVMTSNVAEYPHERLEALARALDIICGHCHPSAAAVAARCDNPDERDILDEDNDLSFLRATAAFAASVVKTVPAYSLTWRVGEHGQQWVALLVQLTGVTDLGTVEVIFTAEVWDTVLYADDAETDPLGGRAAPLVSELPQQLLEAMLRRCQFPFDWDPDCVSVDDAWDDCLSVDADEFSNFRQIYARDLYGSLCGLAPQGVGAFLTEQTMTLQLPTEWRALESLLFALYACADDLARNLYPDSLRRISRRQSRPGAGTRADGGERPSAGSIEAEANLAQELESARGFIQWLSGPLLSERIPQVMLMTTGTASVDASPQQQQQQQRLTSASCVVAAVCCRAIRAYAILLRFDDNCLRTCTEFVLNCLAMPEPSVCHTAAIALASLSEHCTQQFAGPESLQAIAAAVNESASPALPPDGRACAADALTRICRYVVNSADVMDPNLVQMAVEALNVACTGAVRRMQALGAELQQGNGNDADSRSVCECMDNEVQVFQAICRQCQKTRVPNSDSALLEPSYEAAWDFSGHVLQWICEQSASAASPEDLWQLEEFAVVATRLLQPMLNYGRELCVGYIAPISRAIAGLLQSYPSPAGLSLGATVLQIYGAGPATSVPETEAATLLVELPVGVFVQSFASHIAAIVGDFAQRLVDDSVPLLTAAISDAGAGAGAVGSRAHALPPTPSSPLAPGSPLLISNLGCGQQQQNQRQQQAQTDYVAPPWAESLMGLAYATLTCSVHSLLLDDGLTLLQIVRACSALFGLCRADEVQRHTVSVMIHLANKVRKSTGHELSVFQTVFAEEATVLLVFRAVFVGLADTLAPRQLPRCAEIIAPLLHSDFMISRGVVPTPSTPPGSPLANTAQRRRATNAAEILDKAIAGPVFEHLSASPEACDARAQLITALCSFADAFTGNSTNATELERYRSALLSFAAVIRQALATDTSENLVERALTEAYGVPDATGAIG